MYSTHFGSILFSRFPRKIPGELILQNEVDTRGGKIYKILMNIGIKVDRKLHKIQNVVVQRNMGRVHIQASYDIFCPQ